MSYTSHARIDGSTYIYTSNSSYYKTAFIIKFFRSMWIATYIYLSLHTLSSRQGFNPRDERKWPSAQPSKSPTIKPSIMPTSLSPTHLPTMSVTPRPTLSPGPTHPFIWIGRLILISVLLFALVVKYRNDILQYRGE